MRPILFAWRGVVVHSFQVMVYLALLVTVLLTGYLAQRAGLNADRTVLAVLLLLLPGFAGARLFYVARHWHLFRGDRLRILRRSEGGLSLYGGLVGMFTGSVPLLWALGLPFAAFWDALALGALAGIVAAKGGCFLNGCCYGRPTAHWCGVGLPDQNGGWRRRFPSQPLEMAWAAVVLLLLLALRSAAPPAGAVASAAVILHPAGRLFLQKLRDEGDAENAAVLKTCLVLIAGGLGGAALCWLW
ncbi:MAG: prolipoprotein diacylglyceryl transferase family protein [Pseudolabrys sp.]|jgi:phosphatidylglycerol:prolipoprotein diacylglycerol transferase